MKATRKRYSADFKAKVAMEAIRGDLTLAELAAKHGVHYTMIGAWKRQAMEGMASLFDGGDQAVKASSEAEIEKLHAKIDPLHIGQIIPDRQKQGLEHRQRRPGRFALGGWIKRLEKCCNRAPTDY